MGDKNPRKRLKAVHEPPTHEEIHAARQLQQLLTFDQDPKKARHGKTLRTSISIFGSALLTFDISLFSII